MTIRAKVTRIKEMQKRLSSELATIQKECQHPNATGQYKANTGNWCEADDSYWIQAECPDCDKRWTIDSDTDNQEYKNFPKRCTTI